MARRRSSNAGETMNAWPGFVDALSTLLMVIIFVLLVFVLAQAFLSVALSGRDQALTQLHRRIAEMSELLTVEHSRSDALRTTIGQADLSLRAASAQKDALAQQLAAMRADQAKASAERDQLQASRDKLAAQLGDAKLQAQTAQDRNSDLEAQQSKVAKLADVAGQGAAAASAELLSKSADLARTTEQLKTLSATRDSLEQRAREADATAATAERKRAALDAQLGDQTRRADSLQSQISSLSQEIAALRTQLTTVSMALNLSETSSKNKDIQITDLGSRLDVALARKVEELQQYRSEFFGRLRQVLANQPGVQVVGDRFVFQSEVLFPPGNADLSQGGLQQIAKLAQTLKEIIPRIPTDVNWLLRVDGHADRQSVLGTQYPSNWDLSAARAIKVVQLLAAEGVPANRLAATAFGDNQPLDLGNTPDAFAKNRRIEIRLTDR